MALGGWIKIHRALAEHHIASDPQVLSVWLHLLMMANHIETKRLVNGRILTISAGQLITSRRSLSVKTGVQESKIERILTMLKREQQIEQQGTTKFRLISIVNWASYQIAEQQNEQQTNNRRTADEQQMNTLEEVQEGEECKEEIKSLGAQKKPERVKTFSIKDLIAAGVDEKHARDWLAVRKAKKSPLTETALDGVMREAKLAGLTLGQAVKESAERGWVGFKMSWLANVNQRNASSAPVNRQQQIEDANNAVVLEIAARERRRREAEQGKPPQDDFIGTGEVIIEGEYQHAQ